MPMSVFSPVEDVELRPAHVIPKAGEGFAIPRDYVALHHPGWQDSPHALLFTLPACSINKARQPCAEYLIAWQGCYAIAIDQPGFFTTRRERTSDRVAVGCALVAGNYWYHLDDYDADEMYATLQSAREWRYNPDNMPQNWPDAVPWAGREDNVQTDRDCCMTGEDFARKTHLVATTGFKWLLENDMCFYAGTSGMM